MPDKLKMHSPDLTDANIAKLLELFPGVATETKDAETGETVRGVDFDLLRQELSDHVVEGPRERYHLDWPGKREAMLAANAPIAKTLRPVRDESVNFDTTQNLFIEGDNLEALKLLQETYLGKVKMIFIDPPYNTGKEFIYDDDFAEDAGDYKLRSGQTDEDGARMVANTEANGRYHSDWLSMMLPRLKLARNLLRDDGVIFIAIDDHEVANLRRVCDEVFGEANFVAQITWEKGRKNDAKLFSVGHEYLICYCRDKSRLKENGTEWREEKPGAPDIWGKYLELREEHRKDDAAISDQLRQWYSDLPKKHPAKKWSRYKRIDKHGPWRDRDISYPGGDGPRYDVIHPVTKKPCVVPPAGWRFSEPEEMDRQISLGLVEFREDHTSPPFRKVHLKPIEGESQDNDETGEIEFATQVRGTYLYKQSQPAVDHLKSIFGAKVFNNPKDHTEISRLVKYVDCSSDGDIVVDFFAGSGSTAEAVSDLVRGDEVSLRYILVQVPESLDDLLVKASGAAKKVIRSGIRFLDEFGLKHTIAEISKERLRRVCARDAQGGFRVLKIDSSNLKDIHYTPDQTAQQSLGNFVDHIKEDRSDEDLLFQVMLDWGVDLGAPIASETIAGHTVWFVAGNALAACFETGLDDGFVKALAQRGEAADKPLRVVFRDAGFADDDAKINAEQIFKTLSPATEVKVL